MMVCSPTLIALNARSTSLIKDRSAHGRLERIVAEDQSNRKRSKSKNVD